MGTSRSSNQRFRIAPALPSALGQAALLLGCVTALECSLSSRLDAQTVQFRPQAGLSLPTRISIQNRVLHVRQKIGLTFGARMTITFSERFDIATGVTYIPGYATFRGAGKRIDVSTSSHLLTGSTGARYWLLPPGGKLSWDVHTGFGVVFGGQPAYEDLFEASTVSGILGTTAHYTIGRIARVQLKIQQRLYRVRFGGVPLGSKPPLQVSLGLGLLFVESAPDPR